MRSKQKHYLISNIFYGKINNDDCFIYEEYIKGYTTYSCLLSNKLELVNESIIGNYSLDRTLKEEIHNKRIEFCLLKKDGSLKNDLTIDEIVSIIQLANLLDNNDFKYLDNSVNEIVLKIVSLFNINSLDEDKSIIIPALKVMKFRNVLFDYIKTSIIMDDELYIKSDDYRVLSALSKSKIKILDNRANFEIVYKDGIIEVINDEKINDGFQRIIKIA